jgi:hypothetical protein
MRIRLLLAALVAAAVTALVSAQSSFNLRLGQWEYTINMKMPPEMLAQIPAAARAQFERPQTNRSCLTAKDLSDLNLGRTEDDCKVTSKKITGNAADIVMICDGRPQTLHYEALSPESVRGTIKSTGGEGPSELTIAGKWVAAACKE